MFHTRTVQALFESFRHLIITLHYISTMIGSMKFATARKALRFRGSVCEALEHCECLQRLAMRAECSRRTDLHANSQASFMNSDILVTFKP